MNSTYLYAPLGNQSCRIDKTEKLEKGIHGFPSVYIEGAAGSGKTTAMKILLKKNPQINYMVFWMDEELLDPEGFIVKIGEIAQYIQTHATWIIFENVLNVHLNNLKEEYILRLKRFIHNLKNGSKLIFISREKPIERLLDLVWSGEMGLLSQNTWFFTRNDIRRLADDYNTEVDVENLFRYTGGWPGCINVMLRISERDNIDDVEKLHDTYEVKTYIKRVIIDSLSLEEQELVKIFAMCPWLDENIGREIWKIDNYTDLMESLYRKGMLTYNEKKKRARLINLFKDYYDDIYKDSDDETVNNLRKTADYYVSNDRVKEAIILFKSADMKKDYRRCMIKNYREIPFINENFEAALYFKEDLPEVAYLRAMFFYFAKQIGKMTEELKKIEKMHCSDSFKKREIILNLIFLDPEYTLDDFINKLVEFKEDGFELYGIMGGSFSFLSGMRDLSELFACSKKQENYYAKIWKAKLTEKERVAYKLAKIEYYMETLRRDSLKIEDFNFSNVNSADAMLNRIYLICKDQRSTLKTDTARRIEELEADIQFEENTTYSRNAESLINLSSPLRNNHKKFVRWLKYSSLESNIKIRENNYVRYFLLSTGYVIVGQYDYAQRILSLLIPYLALYKRSRLLAEAYFQMAIIENEKGNSSQMLKNMIQTVLMADRLRYVDFYTEYGKKGYRVLLEIQNWIKDNVPGNWSTKKKYNYSSVLKMPKAEYLELICFRAKKRSGDDIVLEGYTEKLTMTESLVLNEVAKGLTNAQICEVLNLKLPTVKAHLYTIFQKLNVNSRMQAVVKARQLGMII